MIIRPLSTRLFPAKKGVDAYQISGIAASCDCVVLSDRVGPPYASARCRNHCGAARTVFLSLRYPEASLSCFENEVLPKLQNSFVLISGSSDATMPNQIDSRFPPFSEVTKARIGRILDHPLLVRWYAENLDEKSHSKFMPLPLGLVRPGGADDEIEVPEVPCLRDRPLKMLCAHRSRDGEQWDTRKLVSQLATLHWRDFADVMVSEVPERRFIELLREYAFVLCVEGGGLDPSPKAWLSILNGAIPIIRKTPTHDAYAQLPVVFVDEWHANGITESSLALWRKEMLPFYDIRELRSEVLGKLAHSYWWEKITTELDEAGH